MHPSPVHEHGSKKCYCLTTRTRPESLWDKRPALDELLAPAQLEEENQNIDSNQQIRQHRDGSALAVVVTDRKHVIPDSKQRSYNRRTKVGKSKAGPLAHWRIEACLAQAQGLDLPKIPKMQTTSTLGRQIQSRMSRSIPYSATGFSSITL